MSSALEIFLVMRYINVRFTYLLTVTATIYSGLAHAVHVVWCFMQSIHCLWEKVDGYMPEISQSCTRWSDNFMPSQSKWYCTYTVYILSFVLIIEMYW